MPITTYTELRQAVADWLNRVDLDQQIPDFIRLAEATFDKTLRNGRMVATASIPLTSNTRKVNAPTDMLEPLFLTDSSDEDFPLEQVTIAQLTMLRRARLRTTGKPRFYAMVGRAFELGPTPAAAGTLECVYYQQIPRLSASVATNWVLDYHPDLYLYTSLLHAAPFLQDDVRTGMFRQVVADQIAQAVQANQTSTFETVRSAGFSLDKPGDPATIGVGSNGAAPAPMLVR